MTAAFYSKWRILFLYCMLAICTCGVSMAGDYGDGEEISVNLHVKGIGSTEIPAYYYNGEVYLPAVDVFDFLRIKHQLSANSDSITGYIINRESAFTINYRNKTIFYNQRLHLVNEHDMVMANEKIFLHDRLFGEIFGLRCNFNFRNLSVILETDIELPVIKEMRQELMRANIGVLQGGEQADTIIRRKPGITGFGMADWSVINSHRINGRNDTRVNVAIGSAIAGGELNMALNYNSRDPFSEKQQYYLWRHVNNNRPYLRQTLIGKIQPRFISSVYAPAVGVQLTNTATSYKKSLGYYTLSNTTNPGWIVELYVNNVLINYVKADASGLYSFQVPLIYGTSVVRLRFYGPYGEEKATEQIVHVPFNFIPKGQLEYNVSAGFLEDGMRTSVTTISLGDSIISRRTEGRANSIFSHSKVNYGINRFITVGGGVETMSSVTDHPIMAFVNTSVRISPSVMFTTEYTDKVISRSTLTVRLPSYMQLELNYTVFDKNQKAISYNYREQRKAVLTVPFQGKKFAGLSRMAFDQVILSQTKYTVAEWMISCAVSRFSANISSYAIFMKQAEKLYYSNISLGIRLPAQFVITPQVQYEYSASEIISAKATVEKRVSNRLHLQAYYESNLKNKTAFTGVGLRYDFDFTRVGASVVHNENGSMFMEHASGSMVFDNGIHTDNRSGVGKGGITVAPFLDLNYDGTRNNGEPAAKGLKLNINGGHMEYSAEDTITRVYNLEPFATYNLKLQPGSFENISWFLNHHVMNIEIEPNNMKLIEIPVTVAAEISGTVLLQRDEIKNGQGKIVVMVFDEDGNNVAKTLTEQDGYFSMLSLKPGKYYVKVDPVQMKKLDLISFPESIPVTVSVSEEGDVIDGLSFVLQSQAVEIVNEENEKQ